MRANVKHKLHYRFFLNLWCENLLLAVRSIVVVTRIHLGVSSIWSSSADPWVLPHKFADSQTSSHTSVFFVVVRSNFTAAMSKDIIGKIWKIYDLVQAKT